DGGIGRGVAMCRLSAGLRVDSALRLRRSEIECDGDGGVGVYRPRRDGDARAAKGRAARDGGTAEVDAGGAEAVARVADIAVNKRHVEELLVRCHAIED